MRVIRAIGILSKLRINTNFNILKTAYHSLFDPICNMVRNYMTKKTTKQHSRRFKIVPSGKKPLKVQSCKLYNNKYMIGSTHITNTEIFALIAFLVFKLLSRKVLFINRKDNRKSRLLFKKIANFKGKLL